MSDRQGKGSAPPTLKPGYDLEAFARETDSRIRIESLPLSDRPTAPPPPDAVPRASDVPVLAISREDLEWFELSEDARDLLRQVNGRDTVAALSTLLRIPEGQLVDQLEALAREGLLTWR